MAATVATPVDSNQRVDEFKRDLLEMELADVVRKHITTGEPVAISAAEYYDLRRQVAANFAIHPSAVVLVGSSRLGFSLKKKGKPEQRYQQYNSRSDLDVAVISQPLFDSYWDTVFDLVRVTRDWTFQQGKTFARDLFNGWITPSALPNLPRFEPARQWSEFFASLSSSRAWGIRRVEGRLYRDWPRLEAYQQILVSQCRNELRNSLTQ